MEFQSKSDVVTAALRESIITGELKGGTPLRQRDLAEKFGVSPTPVREALRRLQAEGLIDHDVHRGGTVTRAAMGATQENYEIRAALESLAARLAAERIDEAQLERLEQLHLELSTLHAGDPEASDVNRRFHFEIYRAARSPMLLALLRLLWGAFPFEGPQRGRPLEDSVNQHRKILDALRRGNAEQAEQLVRTHILEAVPYLSSGNSGSTPRKARTRRRPPAAAAAGTSGNDNRR